MFENIHQKYKIYSEKRNKEKILKKINKKYQEQERKHINDIANNLLVSRTLQIKQTTNHYSKEIKELKEEIKELKEDKEKLYEAHLNSLLQQENTIGTFKKREEFNQSLIALLKEQEKNVNPFPNWKKNYPLGGQIERLTQSIVKNCDPSLMQYQGLENRSLSASTLMFNNDMYHNYINIAFSAGQVLISSLGETYMGWFYRKYTLIDKVIRFQVTQGIGNIRLSFSNQDDFGIEETKQANIVLKPYNDFIQNNNYYIINFCIKAEKYGGAFLCFGIKNNELFVKSYTRFELYSENDTAYIFNDGISYNKNNVIVSTSSSVPDTKDYKEQLRGWGFSWLDRYLYDFLYIASLRRSMGEIAHSLQMIIAKTDKLSGDNYFDNGVKAKELAKELSRTSNNKSMVFNKDTEIELLNSGVDFEKLQEVRFRETAQALNVPLSLFLDGSGDHIFYSGNRTANNNSNSQIEINRLIKHYNLSINFLKKILYDNIDNPYKNDINVDDLIFEYNPPESFDEKTKLENENLKQDIELKKAQIQEIKQRLTNVYYGSEDDTIGR